MIELCFRGMLIYYLLSKDGIHTVKNGSCDNATESNTHSKTLKRKIRRKLTLMDNEFSKVIIPKILYILLMKDVFYSYRSKTK